MSRRTPLALLAFVLALGASPAWATPPMWIAKSAKSTVILFGSVHMLPAGVAWRSPALDAAEARADALWFELPIDDVTGAEAARLARLRGLLPAGDRLTAHLSPDQAARLARVAQGLGAPLAALQPMRPWLAEVTLSLLMDTRDGALASEGVEQRIQQSAPATLTRGAFETPAQQIGFLAGATMADQIASLDETLTEYENAPQTYRRLVDEWLAGDLAGLEADALVPARRAAPGSYRRLITQRNQRWARVLRRRLAMPGTTLVVVGVAHLIGPGGVPALLRAEGFTVEGPS